MRPLFSLAFTAVSSLALLAAPERANAQPYPGSYVAGPYGDSTLGQPDPYEGRPATYPVAPRPAAPISIVPQQYDPSGSVDATSDPYDDVIPPGAPAGPAVSAPQPAPPVGAAREWPPRFEEPAPTGAVRAPLRPPAELGHPQGPGGASASLTPSQQAAPGEKRELHPRLRRQLVNYPTREPAGTIIVDTPNTYLYLVLGNGQAIRYGVGVGRQGFTWSGRERITKKAEWPDWHPPAEMIGRQPFLPRFMAGGPGNPMGSRAMYLGKTMYRIHGTNEPHMIGQFGSSGCIRMLNEDAEDLYRRVGIGTQVLVLPAEAPSESAAVNAPRPVLR